VWKLRHAVFLTLDLASVVFFSAWAPFGQKDLSRKRDVCVKVYAT
jgi:hypothetical protein